MVFSRLQIQILGFMLRKHSLTKKIFFQITIPPGAYEIENLNNEIKRIIIDKSHYTIDE